MDTGVEEGGGEPIRDDVVTSFAFGWGKASAAGRSVQISNSQAAKSCGLGEAA